MPPTRSSRSPPTSSARCRPLAPIPLLQSSAAHAKRRTRWSRRPPMPPATSRRSPPMSNVRLSAAGADAAASILNSARETQTTLVTASSDAAGHVKNSGLRRRTHAVGGGRGHCRRDPQQRARGAKLVRLDRGRCREQDQGDLDRHRALARCRHRQHHRQHPGQRDQRAERADQRLQRSHRQGEVDLDRYRALGARRRPELQFGDERQDQRDGQLRAAADRPPVADDRRQARLAGRGDQRQDQPAHDRDRPRHHRCAEVDRDPRPGVLAHR